MPSVRRAVIDVGTNSVKLLLADVAGDCVLPIIERSRQTRLGRGFYESQRLQSEPIASTARAVAQFAEMARESNAQSIRVFATSAGREAANARDLISAIETASGLKLEIVSGDQEAEWAFHGVTTDTALARQPLLLLDVGGGSTEFILGCGGHKHFRASFPLGTVRLIEQLPHSDPPRADELTACRRRVTDFLRQSVRPDLAPAMQREAAGAPDRGAIELVGTGGTTSILACMEAGLDQFDRERIEHTRLSLDRVRSQVDRLWNLPLAERQQIVGLPKNRADVILAGVVIYEAVMDEFQFAELRVSTRGLRFGAVMEAT